MSVWQCHLLVSEYRQPVLLNKVGETGPDERPRRHDAVVWQWLLSRGDDGHKLDASVPRKLYEAALYPLPIVASSSAAMLVDMLVDMGPS